MTISSNTRTAGPFIGTGVLTTYPFAFKVFNTTDVLGVFTDTSGNDTQLVNGTDFTVVLSTDQNANPGGTITYVPNSGVLPLNDKLTFTSNLNYFQTLLLTQLGGFSPPNINDAFDRCVILIQQVLRKANAALQFPLSDGSSLSTTLPTAAQRAGRVMAFDPTTGAIVVSDQTLATIEAGSTSAAGSATAAAASAVLAQSWAVLMNALVAATDFSAKMWAIGGTGLTGVTGGGAAKDWAIDASSPDGSANQSSKTYAAASGVSAAAAAASATSAGANANFYASSTGGTGNVLTATTGLGAYSAGQRFTVIMSAANSVNNPTMNFDAKGAKNIKQMLSTGKGVLVAANAYYSGYEARFLYDGTDLILENPAQLYGTAANIQTGTDLTGTDAINVYNQFDSYNPSSAVGAVGAVTNPGISASTSGGTGTSPSNNVAADLIGGSIMYAYIASAYTAAAAAVGRVVGSVTANLGGAWEVWTKADGGVLTKALTIDQNQSAQFVNDVQMLSQNGSQLAGFRNIFINGGFDIWQRGITAALTSSVAYISADRWAFSMSGTPAGIANRDQTACPAGFRYNLKLGRTAASTSTSAIDARQAVTTQNSIPHQGKQVTLSFYAKAGANFSSASSHLGADLWVGTGVDEGVANFASWTSASTPISTVVNLTTTLTRYSFTGTIPAGFSEIGLRFSYVPVGTAGADDNVYITGVQLEEGPVATPFEHRPFQTELGLCQRHYNKTFPYNTAPAQNTNADSNIQFTGQVTNNAFDVPWTFPVQMHASPTITTYSPNAANANWSLNANTPTAVVSRISELGAILRATTAITVANSYWIHCAAVAEV